MSASETESDSGAASESTTAGSPAETLHLYDHSCELDTIWTAYWAGGGSQVLMCGTDDAIPPTVAQHDTYVLHGSNHQRVVSIAMPLQIDGEIDGEYFGLELDDFVHPVLRGDVACGEDPCSLSWLVQIYTSADLTPADEASGVITDKSGLAPFEVDLSPHYSGAKQFSILLFAAVEPGTMAAVGDRAYWIDLRIEDDG